MTVVDSVFKRAYFILIHTIIIMEGTARSFLHHMWKIHSLSFYVISDRGLQFIALFTKKLYCLLEVEITSSTVWHPQSDD